jgi:hypothetical protein
MEWTRYGKRHQRFMRIWQRNGLSHWRGSTCYLMSWILPHWSRPSRLSWLPPLDSGVGSLCVNDVISSHRAHASRPAGLLLKLLSLRVFIVARRSTFPVLP